MCKIPIWIDCDPGNDDAVAILLSLFDDNFDLVGISTVHGNTTIENTTYNALALATALGSSVPIYKGYGVPLKAKAKTAHHIHGIKGIGGFELLPIPTIAAKGKEEEFLKALLEQIITFNGELSIVAIGPLTNMAIFFTRYPELRSKVKFISIMGGAVSERTWKIGEFNITTDPEAGKYILMDEVLSPKLVLIPSDLTHKAIADVEIQQEILSSKTKLRKLFYEIIMCFAENYRINKGFVKGPPVHDPLAVFVLLTMYNRSNGMDFKFHRYNLKVIVDDELENGRVYLDHENSKSGLYIGYDLDVKVLWKAILNALEKADSVATINQQDE